MSSSSVVVSLPQLAKLVDHSLLQPFMTDAEIEAGLKLARHYNVGAACIKPYSIPLAKKVLEGSDVAICTVIGFPHGNSTTEIKVLEATKAVEAGATDIDMVVKIGKVLSGALAYIGDEIAAINDTVVGNGVIILKVIFESDFLDDEHIIELCKICTRVGVAFVKTSTGYGFVKQANEMYSYNGATLRHLKLTRENSGEKVKIKAAGGLRSLDGLLTVVNAGVRRVGLSATAVILDEAKDRGIGDTPIKVELLETGFQAVGLGGGGIEFRSYLVVQLILLGFVLASK